MAKTVRDRPTPNIDQMETSNTRGGNARGGNAVSATLTCLKGVQWSKNI